MKKTILITIFLFIALSVIAQHKMKMMVINGDTFYIVEPSKGDKLLEKNNLSGAIKAYRKEFKKDPGGTAYNFACALARNNEIDSAFKYLNYDAARDTFNFGVFALSDPDFITLHSDKRWLVLRDSITARFQRKYPGRIRNMPLAAKLWDMMAWDQAYYNEIFMAEKEMGMTSPVVSALWRFKDMINDRNRYDLDSIIKANGWPKISDVGQMGASAAFLIVQHSDLALQQQYLPTIKALCEQNEASWSSYALMYDRVQINQNLPQLYGSQLRYNPETKKTEFFPIEDEANVNKRRAEMGLQPIEQYALQFGIKYEAKK